jgi:hypothetical protein
MLNSLHFLCFVRILEQTVTLVITHHQQIGFYNRSGECLQRGTKECLYNKDTFRN